MSISDLPALNATLNATAAVFLVTGYVLIRRGHQALHKKCMLAALTASTDFTDIPMHTRALQRAYLLLAALIVLAPPVVTFAFQPAPDVLHGAVNALRSIPGPEPVQIRPRLFVAYGALVAASTLGILYLY